MKQLFCDCKTDEEKANFFLSGRAVETGIIAPAISNDVSMAYHRCAEFQKEIDTLRAKVAEMEKQEPLDAGSDVFRSAFEAALKAGNWPATRQGDGYRSPSTQIAWRIAFSTVNRLKLYALPGAQPAPSVPTGWKLVPIDPTRNMLDIMDLGSNMLYRYRALLAAAPEVKP